MTKQTLSITLAALLAVSPLAGAPREVVETDWNGFQEQVKARKWIRQLVRISIAGGKSIKTELLDVNGDGLVAPSEGATKRWGVRGQPQVTIPKDQVISVRFTYSRGRGRAIGTLAGLGAGLGVAGAVLLPQDASEGVMVILKPAGAVALVGIGALVGYLAGSARDHQVTEFVLTH